MFISNIKEAIKKGFIKIERGFAFKGSLPPGSEREHICIIVNKPRKNNPIYYVYITSQEEKVKKRLKNDSEAIVEILQSEYVSELSTTSYVQCSKTYIYSMDYDELIKKFGANELDYTTQKPSQEVFNRITEAICNSITFSTVEIRKILG